ncbi:MAG TPA: isoprenylcysteine carboxylmethyltransferase family protein [Mycoplana sp.]|nr:isoprenylcysteine carboxylmethyltransferase family protein [Mycoplana sp.]
MRTSVTAFKQKKRISLLWLFAFVFLPAIAFVQPYWVGGRLHEALEVGGLMLVFFGILGRLWSILYIGAHKNRKLVDVGPYSMTRNPLYLSSLAGVFGVGLMVGSLVVALSMTTACYVVFHYTARREALYLRSLFGPAYDDYARRTPLFLPNPSLYKGATSITFSQPALAATFRDSLFLLALFPLIEGLEYLRTTGHLPTLVTLF